MKKTTTPLWIVWMSLAMMLAGCGGGDTLGPGSVAAPSGLRYSAPDMVDVGASVAWAPTVSGEVTHYAVSPALPAGLALNGDTGVINGAATAAVTSASYEVTASNAGGSAHVSLTFGVKQTTADEVAEVKLTGPHVLPAMRLSLDSPTSGAAETVTVEVPGATRIDMVAAGSGCGTLRSARVDAAVLTQTGTVADSGQCQFTARVESAAGVTGYSAEFTIAPTVKLPAQGLSVSLGTYFPSGDVSLMPTAATVAAGLVSVPQTLVNGGHASLYVTQTGRSVAQRAILQVSEVPGYYDVPLTWDATLKAYRIDLQARGDFIEQLPASALRAVGPKGADLTARVYLVAPEGGVSLPASATLPVQAVGSGPIQVSLSWVGAADVDLHVVTPGGAEIYYDRRSDTTGGVLDLDSNAGCAIDAVNAENAYWGNGTTPAAGSYTVKVDYWSNCRLSTTVPYTVHVTQCGVSQTYTGTLSADQDDQGGAGKGITIAKLDYHPCNGLSVAGAAHYDDYASTASGLSGTPTQKPVRYAKVEVHKSADDTVLATGQTDESGNYFVTFSMVTAGKYYVKVLASQSLDWVPQKVVTSGGTIYEIRTPDQDAATTPNATGINLDAKRGGSFAEAFNIFDVGVMAFKEVQARFGVKLPTLTWRWTAGVATCGGAASCYHSTDNSIDVLSSATDTDEYDDTVLTHEFGHFEMRQLSRDDSPGGSHNGTYTVPTLAWSEGVATFLGQRIVQSPVYIDTSTSPTFVNNIETPQPGMFPVGTSDGTMSGNLSEETVSTVLWDLSDSAQDSATVGATLYTDKISNPAATYSVLRSWKGRSHDRGVTGADLVDFIDEWLCRVSGAIWEATPGDNFNGLVSQLNQFPYTPQAAPANCN